VQFYRMRGNQSPRQWQRLQSELISSPELFRRFRVIDGPLQGSILLFPTPSQDGQELVIEYVSKFWAQSAGGDGQADFLADTDHIRLDPELFRMGILWHVLRSTGRAYADQRQDFDNA